MALLWQWPGSKIVSAEAIGIFVYEETLCSMAFLPRLQLGQNCIKSPAEAVWMGPTLWLF